MSQRDVTFFESSLSNHLNHLTNNSFEIHSFSSSKYNDSLSDRRWNLQCSENSVCLLVLSKPNFFENVIVPHCKKQVSEMMENCDNDNEDQVNFNLDCNNQMKMASSNLLTDSTQEIFNSGLEFLKTIIVPDNCQKTNIKNINIKFHRDSDMRPGLGPVFLCQTAGHIAKAAYYHQATDLLKKEYNNDNLMGVCLHNKYGGNFAFRGVYILDGVDYNISEENLKIKEDNFRIDYDAGKIGERAIRLLNDDWKEGSWRNVIAGEERYSDVCLKFFSTLPAERLEYVRKEILQS